MTANCSSRSLSLFLVPAVPVGATAVVPVGATAVESASVVDSAVSQWVAIDELNLRSPEQFLSALQ